MRTRFVASAALLGYSLFITTASAQWFSFGAKGGIPLGSSTTITGPFGSDTSRWFTVGPSVEVKLPAGFAIEVDALYQRLRYSQNFISVFSDNILQNGIQSTIRTTGNDWKIPILAKHYFRPVHGWQPFVSAGPELGMTWSHTTGLYNSIDYGTNTVNAINVDYSYRNSTKVGGVAAVGARIKFGRIGLLPEVRYSYWGRSAYPRPQNSVQVLMGVQF
jgi:hypothetical protein